MKDKKNKTKKSSEINSLEKQINNLSTLLETSIDINSILDIDVLLKKVMDSATSVMKAEASSLMLIDELTQELTFEIILGEKGQKIKKMTLPIGQGIAGTVAKTGMPLLVPDASKDPRVAKQFDQRSGFVTKSILCVPLRVLNKVIGVVEVINPLGTKKTFDEEDTALCQIFANLAAVAIANARSYSNIIIDKFTGLYNMGYFREQLTKEIERSKLHQLSFSVVLIDPDNFEQLREKYGYPTVNKVLLSVANYLKNNTRQTDILARFSENKFIVFLPQTNKEEALRFTERIHRNFKEEIFSPKEQEKIKLTASFGITNYPTDTQSDEELINTVIIALSEAKKNGTNQIMVFNKNFLTA